MGRELGWTQVWDGGPELAVRGAEWRGSMGHTEWEAEVGGGGGVAGCCVLRFGGMVAGEVEIAIILIRR